MTDNVTPFADRLTTAGITFERHDDPFDANFAGLQVKDPNGNVVQIHSRR